MGLVSLGTPALIILLAALGRPFGAALRFGALAALRGSVSGESMTTPGGARTTPRALCNCPVLGAPASIMGSEFPQSTLLWPFALPQSYAARLAHAELCR